jgi:hypothetical protein
MSLGGTRVSIASTSPLADASVSVSTSGARSPTSGIGSASGVVTRTCVAAATMRPSRSVTTSTDQRPLRVNRGCAEYTAANGSCSVAACLDR